MKRTDLLKVLETVEHALAAHDMIPVMKHFCFTGSRVFAFNDAIAISVLCKTEFVGALPSTVRQFLASARAKDVEFVQSEEAGELVIQAASSKLKTPYMEKSNFIFKMPQGSEDRFVSSAKVVPVIESLTRCMRSIGIDTSIPEQLGVTVIPGKDGLAFYATNNKTISRSVIDAKSAKLFGALKHQLILPAQFCTQLLKLTKGAKEVSLHFADDHAIAKTSDGTILFCQLISSESPIDFANVITSHVPSSYRKDSVAISSKFPLVIERASIITDTPTEPSVTSVKLVKPGVLRFFSKSARGEMSDKVMVSENHPAVDSRLEPSLLKGVLDDFDRILFSDSCVVLSSSKSDELYIASALGA